MKRTTRVRDARLLKKLQALARFFGKGMWRGNLSEMREDRVPGRSKT
ncbi:MAG: hypothetical protein ABSH46_18745 [Bryobacteraceae bacterium]|jgi:hypothetical protein